MNGALKAGLIFGVVGLLVVAGLTLVFPLCGPVGAAVIGGIAGYYGVRWSAATAGVGAGVLAGTVAGGLMLVGTVVLVVVGFSALRSNPQFTQALEQALQQQQQQGNDLTPEQLNTALTAAAPIAGFCVGLINLVASLAFGAVGGAIAARNRTTLPPSPPQPMGPPPLAPL